MTPDVDLLLQCSFSYMHQGEEGASQEQQLCEKPEETFLDPTGPEEDKEEVGFLTLCSLVWGFESLPFKKIKKIAVTQVILKLNIRQQEWNSCEHHNSFILSIKLQLLLEKVNLFS